MTISITEAKGKSTLKLHHEGFVTKQQVEEHIQGWNDGTRKLAQRVEV